MKLNKKWYVWIALLLICLSIPAFTQGLRSGGAGNRSMGRGFRIAAFLQELDLTPTQKEQIRSVMMAYKPEIKTTVKEYLSSRFALQQVMRANPAHPAPWQDSFKRVTDAEWNGLLLKERIHRDIFKLLTPDQIAKVEAKRGEVRSRIGKFLDR